MSLSDHRLRGNFAAFINEFDIANEISANIADVGTMLGHEKQKTAQYIDSENTIMGDKMLGRTISDAFDIYAKTNDIARQLRILKAFDSISDIFRYLNLPKDKIPHIK